MVYTTPADVRFRLGLREEDASDIHLNKFIIDAQQSMLEELTAYRVDEELYGIIDGSNTYFYTGNRFIADIDFDKIIDANDVVVYLWTNSNDPGTKTVAPVTLVDANIGQIKLTTAPTIDITQITCDYRFYNSKLENWVLVNMATDYLAGYFWVLRDRLLLPDNVRFGSMRWRISFPQWRELWTEYQKMMQRLRGKMVVHGNTPTPVELRSGIPSNQSFTHATEDDVS